MVRGREGVKKIIGEGGRVGGKIVMREGGRWCQMEM